jgi:redox-sensitive bicupin YhaK (pirin superfamily)
MDWLDARGSFPMGHHPRDPENTHFGLLYVHQEDRIAPRSGFPPHPHREVEVVTWVLDGALEHRDSNGGEGVIRAGGAQHMSAGAGITHSEMNPFDSEAHLVQMWIAPDQRGGEPYYSDIELGDRLGRGGWVVVASGREPEPPATLRQAAATLWAARPQPGSTLTLPEAPFVHVFCTRGTIAIAGAGELWAGDAARLRGAGPRGVSGDGELLAWEMHVDLGDAV